MDGSYMYTCDDIVNGISRLSISDQQRHKQKTKKPLKCTIYFISKRVIIDPYILNIDRYRFSRQNDYDEVNNVLTYLYLDVFSHEYNEIKRLFAKQQLIVKSIRKVFNPYLTKSFEMERQFHYGNIKPQRLYHGTKKKHVDSICTYNFNWRLSGLERGHRYGKGVNFSKNPLFTTNFCDKGIKKVIIMADVLIDVVAEGKENLLVPPKNSDTTGGNNGKVFVKFYDNEFCPRYVVDCLQIKKRN